MSRDGLFFRRTGTVNARHVPAAARDPRFTEIEARELLERSGGQHITIIHED